MVDDEPIRKDYRGIRICFEHDAGHISTCENSRYLFDLSGDGYRFSPSGL